MNQKLYEFVREHCHRSLRRTQVAEMAERFSREGLSPRERMVRRFEELCALETPVILDDSELIVYTRTVPNVPDIFTKQEWDDIRKNHFVHELGYISNLSPDYGKLISRGLLAVLEETSDPQSARAIRAVLTLAERYRAYALSIGREDVADVLSVVPAYPAKTFRQALQFFRILHFSLWLEGSYHNTVGRFDMYMYPYFRDDIAEGRITAEGAQELIDDFFLSFNKDSDLYPGVQQGDNGQSMMLGGIDRDGKEVYSDLSRYCLRASEKLQMIDPKINLRVNKDTPLSVYLEGSRLTAVGLGFPQYSNDDVVIPGLCDLGYAYEDAVNYTAAACWEFIIPGVGADIANIGALNFPKALDIALHRSLYKCETFDIFLDDVHRAITEECDRITNDVHDVWFAPHPFLDVLFGCDISKGAKYNNFGIHGTGVAIAADSLAVIRDYVYGDGSVTKEELLDACDHDFAGHETLLSRLRTDAPKMGQDIDTVDELGTDLLHTFAETLKGRRNCRGGIWRAGTGSAMFYLWHTKDLCASPDGRRKGEPYGTNYSPALFTKADGPISVIRSFTKPNLRETVNGGPLTLEFHSSVFDTPENMEKLAQLVRYFILRGGHQLQLNTVNRETLLDAQEHPENHTHLIVRVWGWSAYFVELDREYQNHVIARQEYRM